MALVKYIYGTEAQILALTPADELWVDQAFYYPSDRNYFYQLWEGEMKLFDGSDSPSNSGGTGVTLNDLVLGGIKTLIEVNDVLEIPIYHDYNSFALDVEGIVNCDGQINIL